MKKYILILSIMVCVNHINAQSTIKNDLIKIKNYKMPMAKDFNTWDFGGHLGLTYPSTDISASSHRDLAFGIDITKFLTHSFALQTRFIHGKLSGIDENKPEFQYHTTIDYDLTLNAVFQFGNIAFLKRMPELAFYGSVGIGVIHYSPTVSVDNGTTEMTGVYSQYSQPLEAKDYQKTSDLMIPFGIGCKYHLSEKYSLSAEFSMRTTNSDKLDGFYKLLSDKDYYSYFSVGFTYHFGDQNKTLEWENPLQTVYNDLYDMKDKVEQITNDSDGDGVADLFDREPGTTPGNKVYGDGTSVDADNDGVPDKVDTEPFSTKNAKVDASGKEIGRTLNEITTSKSVEQEKTNKKIDLDILKDSDHDGVADIFDREPNTPLGTKVYGDGTSVQLQEKNTKEVPDLKDSDHDGVADLFDREPNTVSGAKVYGDGTTVETKVNNTTEINSKTETVLQTKIDELQNEIKNISEELKESKKNIEKLAVVNNSVNAGTTAIEKNQSAPTINKISKVSLDSIPSVYFSFNSDRINLKFYKSLSEIAMLMLNNPDVQFKIIGKSDGSTNSRYNIWLSKRRAEAVKKHFTEKYNISPDRLILIPLKKSNERLDPGPLNRRVDIQQMEK